MKKNHKVLVSALSTLTLGLSIFSAFSLNKAMKAEASYDSITTDLFVRVEDPSTLVKGDTVIIVSNEGEVVVDIGGNPGYYVLSSSDVAHDETCKLVYLDHAHAAEFTVGTKTVTYEEEEITVYSFKSRFTLNYSSEVEGYMAYDYRGSSPSRPGSPAIGGVGYFKNGLGARPESEKDLPECWWRLHYVEPVQFAHDGVMDILNLATGGHLCRTSDYWSPFLHWADWSNLNLFKKATALSVVPDYSRVKRDYEQGDHLNLSGLEVTINFEDAPSVTINYDDMPGLFDYAEVVYGTGNTYQTITVGKDLEFNLPVNITPSWIKFYEFKDRLSDYRGTFALAIKDHEYEEPEGYGDDGFNAYSLRKDNGSRISSCWINKDGVLSFKTSAHANNSTLYIDYISGAYRLYYLDGIEPEVKYYIGGSSTIGFNDEREFTVSTSINTWNALTIDYDLIGKYSYIRLLNDQSRYLGESGDFELYGDPYRLYKADLTGSDYSDLDNFKKDFRDATSVCNGFGYEFNITSETWADLAESYEDYSIDLKGYLGNVTYSHNNENVNTELENLIDRYDYIVIKYHETYDYITDFLGRNAIMQRLQPSSSMTSLSENVSINYDSNVIIVITLSLVTLVTASLYMVSIKKRKQQ